MANENKETERQYSTNKENHSIILLNAEKFKSKFVIILGRLAICETRKKIIKDKKTEVNN